MNSGNTRRFVDEILRRNGSNPALAWRLFKHLLSYPSAPVPSPSSIFSLSRALAHARLLPELDRLHHLLLRLPPSDGPCCLAAIALASSTAGILDCALSQLHSLRSHFPSYHPPISLYNSLLDSSLKTNRPDLVETLYKDMLLAGVPPDTYTFNLLISSLCDSGRLDEARFLFDRMTVKGCQPNEFSFGILIRGYCRAGFSLRAVELLDVMERVGCSPNLVIYNTLISSFCREGRIGEAESLVDRMRKEGLFPNVVTFNARISALCKTGKVLEAYRIFRDMQNDELGLPRANQITFNLMLDGFCNGCMVDEARALVESMKESGFFAQLENYNIWLSGLVKNGRLLEARMLLEEMVWKGLKPNLYSYNIVIDGLCKKGMIFGAESVISLMKKNGVSPDTVTYSTLLHGYCTKGKASGAGRILHEMVSNGCFPNSFTCNILLQSLWKEGRISEAEILLQKMNEKGYDLDIVSCNIVIDGLCENGKLDKAMEIVDGMWQHGSAALGELGNAFLGLVDDVNDSKKCLPDLITYSTLISGLCKAGRLDEAKKKFVEMTRKNIAPDSVIYDTFIHAFCKHGKMSSAFKVLRDMEKKGCKLSTRTYNLLIWGLGSKQQFNEIQNLINEMQEKEIPPDVITYNNLIQSLCDGEMARKAASLLEEMAKNGIMPNITSFCLLVKAFCRTSDFDAAQAIFHGALTTCGQKEVFYSLMCNEFSVNGKLLEAKELLQIAFERGFDIERFPYKHLVEELCKEQRVDDAQSLLNSMISKGYLFDPAAFMPVIDALGKRGNKHEADKLSEQMMDMTERHGKSTFVTSHTQHRWMEPRHKKSKQDTSQGSDWRSLLFRDDGSGIAMKVLKRVQKGWGQGSIPSPRPQNVDPFDVWESTG